MLMNQDKNRRRKKSSNWLGNTHASASIELTIIAPMLLFYMAASFEFFNVTHRWIKSVRASYAISDLISRQTVIEDGFIIGLGEVYHSLSKTTSRERSWIRVTEIAMINDDLVVSWFVDNRPNGGTIIEVDEIQKDIPTLQNGDRVILTETSSEFMPLFDWLGVYDRDFTSKIATLPRFSSGIVNLDQLPPASEVIGDPYSG
jgi:hypothetical protein